jgi:amicyanin
MKKGLIIGIVIGVIIIAVIVGVLTNQRATPGTQDKYVNDRLNELFADNATSIDISNFQFSPSTITINVGQTVTWTNKDSTPHTVTSDSGSELASSSLGTGQKYSHTFDTPGTYNYHCSPHPGMKAKVIVR